MGTCQLLRRCADIRIALVCAGLLSLLLPVTGFADGACVVQKTKAGEVVSMAHAAGQSADRASIALGMTVANHREEPLNQMSATTTSKMNYIVATSALHQEWSGNRVDNLAMEISNP
ncbi:hypothetical protein [Dyella sp.]|uniref:hypothetical protein n=1 Tax=Dyella sp. TaxID=1869338 RepID=UPI002B47C778|nr:hypothetical protein [Dyella sp.]HKT28123.1 hypothetical protein [Dyella sp.]